MRLDFKILGGQDAKRSDQTLKSTFLINSSLWVKMYINIGSMSLNDFVDWLGFLQRGAGFCVLSFCLHLLALIVYLLCTMSL